MNTLKNDYSKIEFHNEYEKCGTFGFSNKLLQGVQSPCPDFPSM
jgi:hypothetical protein